MENKQPVKRSARNRRRRERKKQSMVRNAIAISLMLALVLIAAILIISVGRSRSAPDAGTASGTDEAAYEGGTTGAFTTYDVPDIPESESTAR